jgi:mono/diheme cytochrome c family protein
MSKKILSLVVLAAAVLAIRPAFTQAPTQAQSDQTAAAAAFKQYCLGCHSAKLKTGGIVIEPDSLGNVAPNAETWEKVVRQLRAESMPPPGAPRPDHAGYTKMATFLETKLDASAAAKPNVGDLPQLHRLTRTEYKNAIRDLIGLDNLPQEMDYTVLLPADNASSGFDNLADLLFVSPAIMERYLDAARKISRLAVGDPKAPVMVNIHTIPVQHPQDAQVEGLPMGTRGGLAINSYFPLDGSYDVKVETSGQARDQFQIEISVDGERKELIALGGPGGGGRGGRGGGQPAAPAKPGAAPAKPGAAAAQPGTAPAKPAAAAAKPATEQVAQAAPTEGAAPERSQGLPGAAGFGRGGPNNVYRIQVPAGPHLIGVTFAEKTEAIDENVLKPRTRSRGTQPSIGQVTISGPFDPTGPGSTPARQRIFICQTKDDACAKQILSTMMRRAFRRPVTDSDVNELMPFYTAGKADSFDQGIEKAIERLLVSPQFLYRIEADKPNIAAGVAYPITDLELASRISFFLWSSIPDDELLNLAAAGKLRQPGVVEQQVKRMLADPRSESMVDNFAAQWLFLRDLDVNEADLFLFRDFDLVLRHDLGRETELFLDSILRENRPVTELITAKYSFLNERLAKHYGIPNIQGAYFRKVTFPPDVPRGGLLGQGSILMITSKSTRTSPVVRGKYVLDNFLAAPPPPPPANVPSLKTEGKTTDEPLSLRDAMALHRASAQCAACHAKMDPIGFSLENFDAVGRWREVDATNKPIDASTQLVDGTKFTGVDGLKGIILKDPDRFVDAVTEKLMMYALGRNVQYYDAPSIRAIVRDADKQNDTFAALVEGIVKSRPFQMRANEPQKQQ